MIRKREGRGRVPTVALARAILDTGVGTGIGSSPRPPQPQSIAPPAPWVASTWTALSETDRPEATGEVLGAGDPRPDGGTSPRRMPTPSAASYGGATAHRSWWNREQLAHAAIHQPTFMP